MFGDTGQRVALVAVQVGAVDGDRVGFQLRVGVGVAEAVREAFTGAAGQLQLDAAGAGLVCILHREEAPERGRGIDLRVVPVDVEHVGVVAKSGSAALDAPLVVARGVGLVGGSRGVSAVGSAS